MSVSTVSNGDLKQKDSQPESYMMSGKCPHVGLAHDPETWLGFPAEGNCCHYARTPTRVKLSHQETFCLSEAYTACPMLDQAPGSPLPAALRAENAAGGTRGPSLLLLIALVALLLAGIGGVGWWFTQRGDGAVEPEAVLPVAAIETATATATTTATKMPAATATKRPATATATATPLPTNTPSPTPQPTDTPVPQSPTPAPPQAIPTIRINVRTGPGTGYAIIGLLEEGEAVTITGRNVSGGWWQVCCVADEEGWVSQDFVTIEGDTTDVPVIAVPLPPPTVAPTATAEP